MPFLAGIQRKRQGVIVAGMALFFNSIENYRSGGELRSATNFSCTIVAAGYSIKLFYWLWYQSDPNS